MTTAQRHRVRPANDEAHSTPHAAGPRDISTKPHDFKYSPHPMQLQGESEITVFARLARQFERLGLVLYPLSGTSVLVTAPKYGMSISLPDLRAASCYLRQIGGAA
jgi:hypothetical protein